MSNFWANKLGGAAPAPAAPVPAPQGPTGGPWWASPQQGYPTPPQAPQTVSGPQQEKVPARAMVAKQDTHCPDCAGSNFFRPVGMPNAMAQCYECGYNPRFTQTTAGLPSGNGGNEAATPAKQIASGGLGGRSNYNPGAIIRADGSV